MSTLALLQRNTLACILEIAHIAKLDGKIGKEEKREERRHICTNSYREEINEYIYICSWLCRVNLHVNDDQLADYTVVGDFELRDLVEDGEDGNSFA